MIAKVIVDIAHSNVDRLFTYRFDDTLRISRGHRVLVPFGAGNRKREGFVLELSDEEGGAGLKSIIRTMEPYPVLSDEQISLAEWIKKSYNCLLVDALRLMIPAQLRGSRVEEKRIRTVRVDPSVDADAALRSMLQKNGAPRSPRQYEIFKLLHESGLEMSTSDINAFVPGASQAIRALLEKGLLIEQGREIYRSPYPSRPAHSEALGLSPAQSTALDAIVRGMRKGSGAFLLHGITGSGKTEIYMQAIAEAMAMGGTAILLVPEISLTPQTVDRFRSRFGDDVAVMHSRLSPGERYDEWRRLRLGRARVAIGARSAVFAPLDNIRLIVVDEEHEQSYSSEMNPRYSAIEVAERRCRLCGAALVLGSATPSVTSYYRACRGRYTLLELPERVKKLPLPGVEIADMRSEFAAGNSGIFSGRLHAALEDCFSAGGQAILFINRRGYSTFVSCRGCGYVFRCESCDVSLTYHRLDESLKCHYCGARRSIPAKCPECGKPYIKFFGVGTQQVEEQLRLSFPGVRPLRMDADTTRGRNSHYEILSAFARGEAQALIGTQMIAKGLDIQNVSLVGVVAADASLHIPDYRSCERSFQLFTQVAGRAGRAADNGRVIIQTYTPDHPVISFASRHDYKGFFEYELAQRRWALFPPFGLFLRVLFCHHEQEPLSEAAQIFANGLREAVTGALSAAGAEKELIFLVCSEAPIRRKQGLYRYQVLAKLARTANTAKVVAAAYEYANAHRNQYFYSMELNPSDMF